MAASWVLVKKAVSGDYVEKGFFWGLGETLLFLAI
jgi:hypothetical protein